MSEALKCLSDILMTTQRPNDFSNTNLLDSMPIITCSGKRHGKVAKDITDKTFCATKGIWYFGLKLHVLGRHRPNKLPLPESVIITRESKKS